MKFASPNVISNSPSNRHCSWSSIETKMHASSAINSRINWSLGHIMQSHLS